MNDDAQPAASDPADRPPADRLVLGTRGSRLARWQADRVAFLLRERWPGIDVAVQTVDTRGDRRPDVSIPELGGKGVFTAELEAALLGGELDLAVHSLKDLPTDLPEGLATLGVPERADARDVLVWPAGDGGVGALPEGSVVGTSSLRRQAQLLARRPDCEVSPIRGNVETRVEKARAGDYDAVILAAAGLKRLDLESAATAVLEPPGWLPAPAQGALGIEGRSDDEAARRAVTSLEDPGVTAEVTAERSLLSEVEGGCRVPIGARARVDGGRLRLRAVVLAPGGETEVREKIEGDAGRPESVGRELGRRMLAGGAEQILADLDRDEG